MDIKTQEKLFTLQDIIDTWDASERYRAQWEKLGSVHSNSSIPLSKNEWVNELIDKH